MIQTWLQQIGANPLKTYTLGHDLADQLVSATSATSEATPVAEGSDPYGQRYADEICKPVRPCVTNPISNDIEAPYVSCDLAPTPFMPRPGKCGN